MCCSSVWSVFIDGVDKIYHHFFFHHWKKIWGNSTQCILIMVKPMSWISSNVCGCMDWEDEFSLCVHEEFKCDKVILCAL